MPIFSDTAHRAHLLGPLRTCNAPCAGVALLSTMSRAVAGADYGRDGAAAPSPEAFAAQSPTRLLAIAANAPPATCA